MEEIVKEIDLARCRAEWLACVELSKKYKKLRPEDSVFDITLVTEIEYNELLQPEKRGGDRAHQFDTIDTICTLTLVHPQKVAHLIHRLDFVNRNDLTSTDHWETQFTKILLARIYMESGQYDLALNHVLDLALRLEDVQSGYGFVMLIQARAIKGICFEMKNQPKAAIEAYDAAWSSIESKPKEKNTMLSFWIEQCLYRSCILKCRLNYPVKSTLESMRAYVQLATSHWSPHWRMFKRWVICTLYSNYLIQVYKDATFTPATDIPYEIAAYNEFITLVNLFRSLFTMMLPYLNAISQGEYGVSLLHIMMKGHDTLGWKKKNHIQRVILFLYQVKNVTFNNPTVDRFIFLTLLRMGSLEEAKYSLRGYLDLMGVPDFDTEHMMNHDMQQDQTLTTDIRSRVDSIEQRISECSDESIDSMIQVLLAGIHLYGSEEQHGALAGYLSDLALDLLLHSNATTHLDQVYRARGSSYGLIASHCEDPEERALHHEKALASLLEAVQLNKTCWKNHYELGLQQALVRDTHAAILSISQSIELFPHHANAWHLLGLLYSCKRTDDLPKALLTLEAGLSQSNPIESSTLDLPVFSWKKGELNANDIYQQAESYLSIKMSLLTLNQVMHGPESVMDQYKDLFTTFKQLTHQLGISFTAEKEQEVILPSEKKRSTSLIRRTSFTSITSSISSSSRRRRSSSVQSESDAFYSRRNKVSMPAMQRSNSSTVMSENGTKKKKQQLQGIDLGLAKRIGTAASTATLDQKRQESNSSMTTTMANDSAVSLTSMLKPSYSMGSSRNSSFSNSSSRSSSVLSINTNITKLESNEGMVLRNMYQQNQPFENRQKERWQRILVTLWLMSTKTFMKAGLINEANKALCEAEELGLGDAEVWYQLGQLNLLARDFIQTNDTKAINEMNRIAKDAFEKALVIDSRHVPSQIAQAKLFNENQHLDLALGLLHNVTLGFGWDHSEAWYEYGNLLNSIDAQQRSKTCLLFALELNETDPVRSLTIFKRFV